MYITNILTLFRRICNPIKPNSHITKKQRKSKRIANPYRNFRRIANPTEQRTLKDGLSTCNMRQIER